MPQADSRDAQGMLRGNSSVEALLRACRDLQDACPDCISLTSGGIRAHPQLVSRRERSFWSQR